MVSVSWRTTECVPRSSTRSRPHTTVRWRSAKRMSSNAAGHGVVSAVARIPFCRLSSVAARACQYRRWGSRAARRAVRRIVPSNQKGDGPSPGQGQFLTAAEVAALMRVSKMAVYRLVHSGELPAARVGKSFRVPAQAVHAYLDSAYFDAG